MVILLSTTKYFYLVFFEKTNILVTSIANSCFLDIFIWFDIVRQALQNCIFQLNHYIFNTNNVNLQKGVETFGPPVMIHEDPLFLP